VDDDVRANLTAIAQALRVRVPEDDLRALAPAIETMWAGLERLKALPIEGREPAFRPSVRGDGWTGEDV